MPVAPEEAPPTPTTRLGNWYATLLFARPQHLVLAFSEKTLLPVLVPARDLSSIGSRMQAAAGEMLGWLGVADSAIEAELRAMGELHVAKTADRRLIGTMNEMVYLLGYSSGSLFEMARELAGVPFSVVPFPEDATRELFRGGLRLVH